MEGSSESASQVNDDMAPAREEEDTLTFSGRFERFSPSRVRSGNVAAEEMLSVWHSDEMTKEDSYVDTSSV